MAANLDIIYRIAADITGLKDGVDKAAAATESLEGTVNKVGKAIGAAFSVHQVVEFGKVTTAAFGEQEAALRKLETALVAQGQATPAVVEQYAALAQQFQNTTVYSDDLITEMQALLVQVGDVMPNEMAGALRAATDLSAGLGIDLRAATLLVGKAFEGETGTLKKYGIVIDETKLKTEGTTAVLEAIQDKFGGQAQSEVEGYTGKLKQFNNQLNDGQESIGGFLTQGLTPLLDAFGELPDSLKVVGGGFAALTPSLETLTLAFVALGGPSGAMTNAKLAAGGLGTVLTSVVLPAVAVVATAWGSWKLGSWIGEASGVTDVIEDMTGAMMGLEQSQINASREARQHAADLANLADNMERATANAPKLAISQAAASAGIGMAWDDVLQTIKDMDREQDTINEKRKTQAAAEKERRAEEARLIRETQDLESAAALSKAQWQDFLGERAIAEAAADYTRGETQRAAEAQWIDDQLAEQRDLQNELGVLNMTAEADAIARRAREQDAWKGHLSTIGDAFVDLGQIAGESLNGVTRGIGTLFKGIEGLGGSVTSLKSGFSSLGGGSTLQGIASIAGGISGIIGLATAAIQAVKALWNWARGGEEGTVVNPARDRWFSEHGGLEGVNQAAEAATGNVGLTEAIFAADTKSEFDSATAAWERATGGVAMASGGLVTQPTLALLGEHGPEVVTPLGDLGAGAPIVIHTVLEVDGRAMARSTARHLPGVLATQGIPT